MTMDDPTDLWLSLCCPTMLPSPCCPDNLRVRTQHPIPAILLTPRFSCVSQFVFELLFPTKAPTNFLNSLTSHVQLVPMSTLSKIAMWVECPPRLHMNIFSTAYSPSSPNNTYSYAEAKCPIFFNQFHKVDPTGIVFWRWWRTRRASSLPQTNKNKENMKAFALSRWYPLALTYSRKPAGLYTKRGMSLRAGPTGNLFTILSAPPCMTLDQSIGLSLLGFPIHRTGLRDPLLTVIMNDTQHIAGAQ